MKDKREKERNIYMKKKRKRKRKKGRSTERKLLFKKEIMKETKHDSKKATE